MDPAHLRLVFQGLLDEEKEGRGYGDFPWRIDLLSPLGASGAGGEWRGPRAASGTPGRHERP